MNTLKRWYREEDGQDLTEFALLLAFVVIAGAALLTMSGGSVQGIWGTADNRLMDAEHVLQ